MGIFILHIFVVLNAFNAIGKILIINNMVEIQYISVYSLSFSLFFLMYHIRRMRTEN